MLALKCLINYRHTAPPCLHRIPLKSSTTAQWVSQLLTFRHMWRRCIHMDEGKRCHLSLQLHFYIATPARTPVPVIIQAMHAWLHSIFFFSFLPENTWVSSLWSNASYCITETHRECEKGVMIHCLSWEASHRGRDIDQILGKQWVSFVFTLWQTAASRPLRGWQYLCLHTWAYSCSGLAKNQEIQKMTRFGSTAFECKIQ